MWLCWTMQSSQLTLDSFTAEAKLPTAKTKEDLFARLRLQLEDPEKLTLLIKKLELFKAHFPKVRDADDKLGVKMVVPWSGQNRVSASLKVSRQPKYYIMHKLLQRWTMTF